jgi:hypothetical protein
MALAFTTSIVTFLSTDSNTPKASFDQYSVNDVLIFLCAITAIIRFFHGNSSYLIRTYSIPDHKATIKYNFKLAVDFIFILLQGIIFCAMALYQQNVLVFFDLFVTLFIIDGFWFFIILNFVNISHPEHENNQDKIKMKELTNWLVTNWLTAVAMGVTISYLEPANMVPLLFTIIAVNTALDYWQNRRVYFPLGGKLSDKASSFVAARFTTAIQDTGFDPELKANISAIHDELYRLGFSVESAHIEEAYGASLDNPHVFIKRDISAISGCDLFIALLDGNCISSGVCIELGWASLLRKNILLIHPKGFPFNINPMVVGLFSLTTLEFIEYETIDDMRSKLKAFIKKWKKRLD